MNLQQYRTYLKDEIGFVGLIAKLLNENNLEGARLIEFWFTIYRELRRNA